MTITARVFTLRLVVGGIWWGFEPEMRRKRGLRWIGTVAAFGLAWARGGVTRTIGVQGSLGFWHGYVMLEWMR